MDNPFLFSNSNKRYQTLDYYFKNKYGKKVFKVSLNAGFSCPNRDGKVGHDGCIFCSALGSGEYAGNVKENLIKQFEDGKKMMLKKWKDGLAIAYFQAFTNTYGSLEYLHSIYDQFVDLDGCVGIDIATRPDCLNDEIIDYLATLNKKTDLYVELGLQTSNDKTANFINRGYDYKTYLEAVKKLSRKNIKTVVHIINGLPGETKEDMLKTVKDISITPIFGIKFHCLNILKNTKICQIYKEIGLHILNEKEYLDIVKDQLELLPNNIVVERINTDSMRKDLVAPLWNFKKVAVSNNLDKLMEDSNSYQGKNVSKWPVYITFAHNLFKYNSSYNLAVDATLGNGYDSLFLANVYDKVLSFDIQDLAFKRSKPKFEKYDNVEFIKDNYTNIKYYAKHSIDALIYNLGFLPGSDHQVKTNYKDTIESLKSSLPLLSMNGKCVIVSYTVHDNAEEYNQIVQFLESYTMRYIVYDFGNQKVIEIVNKKGD